ncbi:hypothetical protein M569_04219 [Genlisea aurea]|uniref:Uncharacterized protein n=1 Tax=Genlisea aurea TaxID=192259 RepID=S8E482_9LAMI|nr:hypothetical protein M569_04219 [Genlisea aurea]
MEAETSGSKEESISSPEEVRLESRPATLLSTRLNGLPLLQTLLPGFVGSSDLSIEAISCSDGNPFTRILLSQPSSDSSSIRRPRLADRRGSPAILKPMKSRNLAVSRSMADGCEPEAQCSNEKRDEVILVDTCESGGTVLMDGSVKDWKKSPDKDWKKGQFTVNMGLVDDKQELMCEQNLPMKNRKAAPSIYENQDAQKPLPKFEMFTAEKEEGSGPHVGANGKYVQNELKMLERFGY